MNWVREDRRDGHGKRCCRHLGCGSPRNRRARSQASGEDRKFVDVRRLPSALEGSADSTKLIVGLGRHGCRRVGLTQMKGSNARHK